MARLTLTCLFVFHLAIVTTGCEEGVDLAALHDDTRAPIVGGTREPDEPAVVFLYHDWGAGCTASVIAPRVALTAKHCVVHTESGTELPARGFHVYVGPSAYSFYDEYRVTEVRRTPGNGLSNADFALLILDRDFGYETKRWEFVPWPGFERNSTITAIGYGQTRFEDPRSAGTKYRRDGRVADVGPNRSWHLGDAEFMSVGENTCQGDSGGPLIFEDVVVGIVSRGEEGCTGYGWMTRVSAFADMVREALRDTGACAPTSFEVCNGVDDDCWNGVDDGMGPTCGCADGGVSSPEVCDQVDNDCNDAVDDLEACGCADGGEPSEEVCDGIDNDCNGEVDEVCQRLGESCSGDTDCASGMCDELDGERVCTARCVSGMDECPDDGWCDGDPCGDGRCRAARGSLADGETCRDNGECASGFCVRPEGERARCTRSCTPHDLGCYAVEVCQELAESCGACLPAWEGGDGRSFGEPCTDDEQCGSGNCLIDGDPDACGEGCTYRYCSESCGEDGSCPDGAHCREGNCIRGPASELGETCLRDEDCLEGWCVQFDGIARCVTDCEADGSCDEGFLCSEGDYCWPDGARPGDACGPDGDRCDGGECVTVSGEEVCASACDDSSQCPAGLSCVPDDDGRGAWCVDSSIPVEIERDEETGCQCRATSIPSPVDALGPLLVLFVLAVLRRKRAS